VPIARRGIEAARRARRWPRAFRRHRAVPAGDADVPRQASSPPDAGCNPESLPPARRCTM